MTFDYEGAIKDFVKESDPSGLAGELCDLDWSLADEIRNRERPLEEAVQAARERIAAQTTYVVRNGACFQGSKADVA